MGYWEHECTECKSIHDAAFWYYRESPEDRRYVRGEEFNKLKTKQDWMPLEPAGPPGD